MLHIFAGPIFTTQQFIIYSSVAFIIVCTVIAIIILLGRLIYARLKHRHLKRSALLSSLLIAAALIVIFVVGYVIIPTWVKDQRWHDLQNRCAAQVGYSSPADDNTFDKATAESQAAYRDCLDL